MTETEDKNVVKAVVESAERTKKHLAQDEVVQEHTVTMKNGVVFKVTEVPQVAYVDLRNSLPEPTPPIFHNEDTGREEPNPDDPRYKSLKTTWEVAMSMALIDISILFGSEVVSIPKGVIAPNSTKFEEMMKILLKNFGWTRNELKEMSETERYLMWVKYIATRGSIGTKDEKEGDIDKLLNAIGRMSGVPEDDVKTAVENFRNQDI